MIFTDSSQNKDPSLFIKCVIEADIIPSVHLKTFFYQIVILFIIAIFISLKAPQQFIIYSSMQPIIGNILHFESSLLCINNNEDSDYFSGLIDIRFYLIHYQKSNNIENIRAKFQILYEYQSKQFTPFDINQYFNEQDKRKEMQYEFKNQYVTDDYLDMIQTKTYYHEDVRTFFTIPFSNTSFPIYWGQINTNDFQYYDSIIDTTIIILDDNVTNNSSINSSKNNRYFIYNDDENNAIYNEETTVPQLYSNSLSKEYNHTNYIQIELKYQNQKYNIFIDQIGFLFSIIQMLSLLFYAYKLLKINSLYSVSNEHKFLILYFFFTIVQNLFYNSNQNFTMLLSMIFYTLSLFTLFTFLISNFPKNPIINHFYVFLSILLFYPFFAFFYTSFTNSIRFLWLFIYDGLYFTSFLYYLRISNLIRKINSQEYTGNLIDCSILNAQQSKSIPQIIHASNKTSVILHNDGIRRFMIFDFISRIYFIVSVVLIFFNSYLSFFFPSLLFPGTLLFIINNILPLVLIIFAFPQIRAFNDQILKNTPKPHLEIPFFSNIC